MKYIFVTGGVLSGLGKGITAASIGNILKARGFRIYMQKFDQYLNVDAGTLNPGEHGEVFVTEDGAETDLDLGHYERFIDTNLSRESSIMTGNIYSAILKGEREGKFLGKTVQVIPHVTDEVKSRIYTASKKAKCDILITEIGGTVGDYEGLHFLEGIRQMAQDLGDENVAYVHVGFLPYLEVTEELKTKPAQNSIRNLQSLGIKPDLAICRSDHPVEKRLLEKVALFAGMKTEAVVALETVSSVYKVPLILEERGVAKVLMNKLHLKSKQPDLKRWHDLVKIITKSDKPVVTIGLVGKYMTMKDTYLSVTESIKIAAYANGAEPKIRWIDSEAIERGKLSVKVLDKVDGIVVPGGFGTRGLEGKIKAIEYARINNIPFLGLCLGMQMAIVEFTRSVCGLKKANSTEVDAKSPDPVIDILPEQVTITDKGGTMRLGAYPAVLKKGSVVASLYGSQKITERHRHRYEVNPKYHDIISTNGLVLSGMSPNKRLVEFIELPVSKHRYFVATQAHPEFKSRPTKPHPLFDGLVKSAITMSKLHLSKN